MTDTPIIVTASLTLDMVQALAFVLEDLPMRDLPPWVFEALAGLFIKAEDHIFAQPAVTRDDLAWKMVRMGEQQEEMLDLPAYQQALAILQEDIRRLLVQAPGEGAP